MKRWLIVVLLAIYGCSGGGSSISPPKPSIAPSVASSANPSISPSSVAKPAGSVSGIILTTNGKAAAGVKVSAFKVTSTPSSKALHVSQVETQTTTDSSGQFVFTSLPGTIVNIEGTLSDNSKVFISNVSVSTNSATDVGTVSLQPTGSIIGKVTAPGNAAVTNFEGVDVFIPGSSYAAKTDQSGNFSISTVAVGTFSLSASKTGLGKANQSAVQVKPNAATTVPDLVLSVKTPTITQVTPDKAGPGTEVILVGDNFGASTGDTLQVFFSGSIISNPNRVDDQTIKLIVPIDAYSGKIVIIVNGLTSNSIPFIVLRVTSVSVSPTNPDVAIGSTQALTATVQLSDGTTEGTASWNSSDTSKATVDANGVVAGVAAGSVTITATSVRDSSKSGSTTVSISIPASASPTPTSSISPSSSPTATPAQSATPTTNPTLSPTATPSNSGIYVVSTLAGSGVAGSADGTGSVSQFHFGGGENGDALVLDGNGNIYIADDANHRIRRVTPDAVVTTFAGSTQGASDGTGTGAQFYYPKGLTLDTTSGNFYVADQLNHKIRLLTSTGVVTTLAGGGSPGDRSVGVYADGTGTNALFNYPISVVVDNSGNILVADESNQRIRKVTPAGVVTTLAGNGTAGYADGTGTAAQFYYPVAMAIDGNGNIYIADSSNHRIRKMTPAGVVTTVAGNGNAGFADGATTNAQFNYPTGIAVDNSGTVYVSDTVNNRIRLISTTGTVTTLAGNTVGFADGTGTAALFNRPTGIAVDSNGTTIYVADVYNQRIRKLTKQ